MNTQAGVCLKHKHPVSIQYHQAELWDVNIAVVTSGCHADPEEIWCTFQNLRIQR